MTLFDHVTEAATSLAARIGPTPGVALVLGSGLGAFAARLTDPIAIPYADIPHWPPAGVAGHAGRLVAGNLRDRRALVLSGRAHVYEGHPPDAATFGVRVVARLGIRTLVLTNAAGGINTAFAPGTIMAIDDHINLMGTNPLVGRHDTRWGVRFPDMSEGYSSRLRVLADRAAHEIGLPLAHGVYLGVSGPSYETPAEIRAFRTLGADAVGMSTVPETIVARQAGLEVLGLSCITNMAAGILPRPLSEQEVLDTAARVSREFGDLLEAIVAHLTPMYPS
jgi:purine-nucleoside phosphorylase